MSSGPALPWYATFGAAGLAASLAEIATLPIDTAKVRLQLNRGVAGSASSTGLIGTVANIARTEGVLALYKGFWPAIHRQLIFASLRVGLYGQISAMFTKDGQGALPMTSKIAAGLISGAIGITIASPTDLVKVRFQAEGARAPGQPARYRGVMDAYVRIVREEGALGLWKGLGPNVIRNSVMNATELVSYDVAKETLLKRLGFTDGLPVHFLSGSFAGLMATVIGAPVDVVKTRVMAASSGSAAAGQPPAYTGALDCALKTLRNEGPLAFYRGSTPLFFRITGWNIAMFVSFEQLKRVAGALVA